MFKVYKLTRFKAVDAGTNAKSAREIITTGFIVYDEGTRLYGGEYIDDEHGLEMAKAEAQSLNTTCAILESA